MVMNKNLHITAFLDKPDLLEDMVERLAYRHNDSGYVSMQVPRPWKAIESSSTEAFVSGTMQIAFNEKERISMPFITSFLFSCAHASKNPYKLYWSLSLN